MTNHMINRILKALLDVDFDPYDGPSLPSHEAAKLIGETVTAWESLPVTQIFRPLERQEARPVAAQ